MRANDGSGNGNGEVTYKNGIHGGVARDIASRTATWLFSVQRTTSSRSRIYATTNQPSGTDRIKRLGVLDREHTTFLVGLEREANVCLRR
jgi:hypothetical protein